MKETVKEGYIKEKQKLKKGNPMNSMINYETSYNLEDSLEAIRGDFKPLSYQLAREVLGEYFVEETRERMLETQE